LKRLGIVQHRFGGLLITRSGQQIPAIGSAVVTNTMKRIGTVREVFGPVSHPYISVKTYKNITDSEVHELENKKLYTV
jgi:RNA-binding protein